MKMKSKNHIKRTIAACLNGKTAQTDLACNCPRCVHIAALHGRLFAEKNTLSTPPDRVLFRIYASYEQIAARKRSRIVRLVPAGAFFALFLVLGSFLLFRQDALLYSDTSALTARQPLRSGATVKTVSEQRRIFFGDQVEIICSPDTVLDLVSVTRTGKHITYSFFLHDGEIRASFHGNVNTFDYEFAMPDSVLRSSGTEFTISLRDDASRFTIHEGRVSLFHRASYASLSAYAGDVYISNAGGLYKHTVPAAGGSAVEGHSAENEEALITESIQANETGSNAVSDQSEELPAVPAEDENAATDVREADAPRLSLPDVIGVDESERRLRGVEERALRRH